MPYKDLREYLEFLKKRGDLKTCHKEVDTYIEIAKVTDKSSKIEGPAIFFDHVKGFKTPVVTGLFGTIDRSFLAIDTSKYDGFKKLAQGIEKPIPYRLVETGPCKEVIKKGREVDMSEIPFLWHHTKDSHKFITTGICRVKDPDNGIGNNSINRLAVQGKDWLTIQSNPPHQLGIIVAKYLARGQTAPVAIAIGTDPATFACAGCGIPSGFDEYFFTGGVIGRPVEVVKGETINIEVPATAELVLEGEIRPGNEQGELGKTEYAPECPFAEISGYFGREVRSPVLHITAITHREDYIYHALGTADPPSEHQVLNCFSTQADIFTALKAVMPVENIKAISPLMGSAGFGAVISIKKTLPGQARQILYALLVKSGVKRVIVVDEDIDVFEQLAVDWAVSYRAGADDYLVTAEIPGIGIDPMISTPPNLIKKIGIDATLPLNGDKKGRIEVLKELGPARYSDLKELNLADYIGK